MSFIKQPTQTPFFKLTEQFNLNQTMENPNVIGREIGEHNYGTYIYDKDNPDKPMEVFDRNKNEIKLMPKGYLKGDYQQKIMYERYLGTLLNVKVIKTKEDDVLGIETYTYDFNRWKKLKTVPIARKLDKELPSIALFERIEKDYKPYLVIWGGVNYKTGKKQNTIEIIDIYKDKLVEKKEFNYGSGKVFKVYDKPYYVLFTEKGDADTKFFDEETRVINLSFKDPLIVPGCNIFERGVVPFFLEVDKNGNQIIKHSLFDDGKTKKDTIKLPEKFSNYKIKNIFSDCYDREEHMIVAKKENKTAFLSLKVSNEAEEANKEDEFLFIKVTDDKDVNDINFENFILHSNFWSKYLSIIGVSKNKLMKIDLSRED